MLFITTVSHKTIKSTKNKDIALILSIFLGWLGIHRFYVGKTGTGILYLLTGGIFGIGWIVDIVMLVIGSFTDKGGHFLINEKGNKSKQKKWYLKTWAIILWIFLIIAIIVSISPSSNQKNEELIDEDATDKDLLAGIGDPVIVDEIEYIVIRTYETSWVGNEWLSIDADGIFRVIELSMENKGMESKNIYSTRVVIMDNLERTFEQDTEASLYLDDAISFGEQL